jgi:arylsulfatase A-like enzyme
VVFDQHFADAADPAGARRAWRSGRYRLPGPTPAPETESGPDLLAALRACIHTALVLDDSRPAPEEFAAGWDEVVRVAPSEDATPLEATLDAAAAALERLGRRDDWLLWIDLATPLPPWHVPEEFQAPYFAEGPAENEEAEEEEPTEEDEEPEEPLTPLTEVDAGPIDPEDDHLYLSLQTSYAAAVTYLDAGVGQLLEALACLPDGGEVLVLFTTDCGQSLGEHGVVGPVRPWPHDEVIHLPMLLRLPGGTEAGRRVAALTQAVDLALTLADHFNAILYGAPHGHSLLLLAQGATESVRPYACAGLRVGDEIEWALRTPEWAVLLPAQAGADAPARGPRLYVKPDDRWEVNDVRQHHLELAERLEQTLRDFVTAACQPGPLQTPPLPADAVAAPEQADDPSSP